MQGFELQHRRPLGETGIEVAPLALGTVKLGRNTGVKYPAPFELPGDDAVRALLECARELGINMIDTAPAYGSSEQRLGELLPGDREDWVICTKAGEFHEQGESRYDYSEMAVTASVIESLRLLNTDYLDIVLVHSDGNDEDIVNGTDVLESLYHFKDAGEVRAVGFSAKTVEGAMAALPLVDVVMLTLNPDEREQLPVIETAREIGKGVLLKKILASGHHANPAECIELALGVPGVGAAVVGTLAPDHLTQNVAAALKAIA